MHRKKNLLIVVLLLSVIVFGAAIMPQQQAPQPTPQGQGGPPPGPQEPFTGYKNLKVLPKKITKEELEKTMRGFRTALGVRCNFCHASMADNPQRTDFVSDAKPQKETARHMLKMMMAINKKYFNEKDEKGAVVAITCKSCHNGKEKPDMTM